MARTRLAQKTELINRAYYDCNPPGSKHWTAQVFVAKKDPASKPAGAPLPNPDNFVAMVMNPYGNQENLAPEYLKELEALPERQKNRFLLGKYTAELDNALWTPDSFRHVKPPAEDERERVVVAIDPSGASGAKDRKSDEIGIVVAARLRNKRFCVLADRTIRGGPSQWARVAVNAYREFKADTIIAETNYGGAMVMHTIKTEDRGVPVKIVTATRGKVVRAEPISTLYARGEVDHAGTFDELEDQAVNMTTAGYMASARRTGSTPWCGR